MSDPPPNDHLAAFLARHTARARCEATWARAGFRFAVAAYLTLERPPPAFVTSARGIVRVGADLLVALRNPDGRHVMPGGRIEPGETYEATLRREVREETGLAVSAERYLGFLHFRHLTPKPDGYGYPYPDMIHVVYAAEGRGALRSGDTDGWEQSAALLAPARVRSLEGNAYAVPFVDAIFGRAPP